VDTVEKAEQRSRTIKGQNNNQKNAEPRVNRRIRAREVRLISGDGEQLGIVPLPRALMMAEEDGLDLVEVAPNARPPVCKLMDYGKFKYMQKQKAKEAKKNATQIQVKEVKFRPKTDEHDILFKVNHIRRFLAEGNKTKVSVIFRGREITHKERGQMIMRRVLEELGTEAGIVEMAPRMEGRTMIMILAPHKKK
jgi:translation initiation factor IF-3